MYIILETIILSHQSKKLSSSSPSFHENCRQFDYSLWYKVIDDHNMFTLFMTIIWIIDIIITSKTRKDDLVINHFVPAVVVCRSTNLQMFLGGVTVFFALGRQYTCGSGVLVNGN